MRTVPKAPNVLSFRQRAMRCRKLREAQKDIKEMRMSGDWNNAQKLQRYINRVWWGIKRYINK